MLAYWDRDLVCRFANRAYETWFGISPETLLGTSLRDLLGAELFALNEPHIVRALRGEEQTFERIVPGPGGVKRHSLAHYIPDVVNGEVAGFMVQVTDVGRIKDAEAEARRQSETLRSVADAIPITVAVIGADRRYRFANSAFERWCGIPMARIIGHTGKEVLGEQEFNRRWPFAEKAFAGEPISFHLEYPGPLDAIHMLISYLPLMLDRGKVDSVVVVGQDITHQKRKEIYLSELAERDPLTGALNREGLTKNLEHVFRLAGGAEIALLYIDLDHFKAVNDMYGHAAGDRVLQTFVQRMTSLVRPSDAVARLGGDEFAVALFDVKSRSAAAAVAEKIVLCAQEPFIVDKNQIKIGASIGLAFGATPAHGWRQLLERADAKLLAAKAAGKGRHSSEPY